MIFSTEVPPTVLILRNPTAEMFGMLVEIFSYGFEILAAIFPYGSDGLTIAIISAVLYLIASIRIGNLMKSPDDEAEADRETNVHQADAATQGEATNGSDQSHDPIVEEAIESIRTDMEVKETERCADCGDIAQPDSKYCSHCARKH